MAANGSCGTLIILEFFPNLLIENWSCDILDPANACAIFQGLSSHSLGGITIIFYSINYGEGQCQIEVKIPDSEPDNMGWNSSSLV